MIEESTLSQFCGSGDFVRYHSMLVTEGMMYVAEEAGAYWLLDLVWSYQRQLCRRRELQEFQVWELSVELERRRGVIVCRADSGKVPVVEQELPYTDFPLPDFKFYCCNGTVLLPSEY